MFKLASTDQEKSAEIMNFFSAYINTISSNSLHNLSIQDHRLAADILTLKTTQSFNDINRFYNDQKNLATIIDIIKKITVHYLNILERGNTKHVILYLHLANVAVSQKDAPPTIIYFNDKATELMFRADSRALFHQLFAQLANNHELNNTLDNLSKLHSNLLGLEKELNKNQHQCGHCLQDTKQSLIDTIIHLRSCDKSTQRILICIENRCYRIFKSDNHDTCLLHRKFGSFFPQHFFPFNTPYLIFNCVNSDITQYVSSSLSDDANLRAQLSDHEKKCKKLTTITHAKKKSRTTHIKTNSNKCSYEHCTELLKVANTGYCDRHKCQKPRCNELIYMTDIMNYLYCIEHQCTFSGCPNEKQRGCGDYCAEHINGTAVQNITSFNSAVTARCNSTKCRNLSILNSQFCLSHKCSIASCNKRRISHANFCIEHNPKLANPFVTPMTTPVSNLTDAAAHPQFNPQQQTCGTCNKSLQPGESIICTFCIFNPNF